MSNRRNNALILKHHPLRFRFEDHFLGKHVLRSNFIATEISFVFRIFPSRFRQSVIAPLHHLARAAETPLQSSRGCEEVSLSPHAIVASDLPNRVQAAWIAPAMPSSRCPLYHSCMGFVLGFTCKRFIALRRLSIFLLIDACTPFFQKLFNLIVHFYSFFLFHSFD